jgi:MerR family transcriptional regulator, copper efflux regulator
LGVFNINENEERVQIIEKMLTYKIKLENRFDDLIVELVNYYNNTDQILNADKVLEDPINGLKDLNDVNYENSYEAYLITQIKLAILLPSIIEEHVRMLNMDDDIDSVLELFELKAYDIKKNIYCNLGEWELVLDHIDDERISEITCNPKGHGDLLLKELLWIRKCEKKHNKNV